MNIQLKIKHALALLNRAYGRPRPFKKSPPVDELIRTILSQNTTDKNSLAAFAVLKKSFRSWEALAGTDTAKIARLIRHAGLARIKAKRIKEALSRIRDREGGKRENKGREGKISLDFLAKMGVKDAIEYLKSMKGVGPKTAACVLLFSFGKPVMPVDTHIFRVARRLGLIGAKLGIEEAHERLSNIVPKDLIYPFHLGIIEHGRKVCKSQTPKCGVCVVYGLCLFKDKSVIASEAKQSKK